MHLDHICIGSSRPEQLAGFYSRVMQLELSEIADAIVARGPARRIIFKLGADRTLGFAAYALQSDKDLEELKVRLTKAGTELRPSPSCLFRDQDACSITDPDGNTIVFGVREKQLSTDKPGLPARLQHAVVGTAHMQPMVDFYTDVVGLHISDLVSDDAGNLKSCFMRGDDEHHCFAIFHTPEKAFDHHCYEAGDWDLIRDWADRLAEMRIPIDWGPGRHGPGNNLFLMFRDPDRNWIEVSAELEVVAEDKEIGHWPHEEHTLNLWGKGHLRS